MIPAWKLKREAKRIADHLAAIPLIVYEPVVQFFYDRNFENSTTLHIGKSGLDKNVAVFLIYQPNGVVESVYRTLEHLIASGFGVVVVSNCGLINADLGRLLISAALVLERPNFGYDFGGYRDAVRLLIRQGIDAKKVLFLNDSVWFPIKEGSRLLYDMTESESDYVGTQSFGKLIDGVGFEGFFGSYCFMVKEPLIASKDYLDFWQKYRISSSKEVVLRRGERSFSKQMLKSCSRADAIFSYERFVDLIKGLSSEDLVESLNDLIIWDETVCTMRDSLQTQYKGEGSSVKWEADVRALIIRLALTKNYIGSSPVLSINRMNFPMIKKNNEMLYRLARQRIVAAIDEGRITDLIPVVERELRASLRK